MSQSEFNRVTRPQGIVVSAVDLEVDSSAGSRELHVIQAKDLKPSEIIPAIKQEDVPNGRYLV
jgi:hypothetical protein